MRESPLFHRPNPVVRGHSRASRFGRFYLATHTVPVVLGWVLANPVRSPVLRFKPGFKSAAFLQDIFVHFPVWLKCTAYLHFISAFPRNRLK
jgi:hypothetical protein